MSKMLTRALAALAITLCAFACAEDGAKQCGHPNLMYKLIKESTCVTTGVKRMYCPDCGWMSERDVAVPLRGHTLCQTPYVTDPTCAAQGCLVYYCDVCGEDIYSEPMEGLPQPEHELVTYTGYEPTCVEDGFVYTGCVNCGIVIESLVIPALGHSQELIEHVRVEPTCLGAGVCEYVCDTCGSLVALAEIPKTAHVFEVTEWVVEPDCCDVGVARRACVWCAEDGGYTMEAQRHDDVRVEVLIAPTCVGRGYGKEYCALCGYLTRLTVPVEPDGHNFITEEIRPAGCWEMGFVQFRCTLCGYEELSEISPIGHEYSPEPIDLPPTCLSPGMICLVCVRCDAPLIDGAEIVYAERLPHTWSGEYIVREPSCMDNGYVGKQCAVCDYCFDREEFSGALAHEPGDLVITDPTCTEAGYLSVYCKYGCGQLMSQEITFPAAGHVQVESVITLEPTCSSEGAEETRCVECGQMFGAVSLPAVGHAPICVEIIRAASADTGQDGVARMTCKWCLSHLGYERVPYSQSASGGAAICSEDGYKIKLEVFT